MSSQTFIVPDRIRSGPEAMEIDAQALAAKLRRRIQGEVRFDRGARALYATDSSNYRQVPIGVVAPRSKEDLVEAMAVCHEFGVPITSRGAGTSLAGQTTNVTVILDCSKYLRRVIDVDPEKRLARAEPGAILDHVRDEAEKYHLTFGSDTSTHEYCTIGGVIGNNSCGVHSVLGQFLGNGPRTSDNTHELEIVTYDGLRMRVGETSDEELARIIAGGGRRGEIYSKLKSLRDRYADLIRQRYPKIPRRVSGYNLDDLLPENGFNVARALVGSEGTCVTVLEATLHLVTSPRHRTLLMLGYPDIYHAGDHVPEVLAHQPTGLEAVDSELISDMRGKGLHTDSLPLLPEGGGWLFAEFGGDTLEEANAKANDLMKELRGKRHHPSMALYDSPELQKKVWQVRESGLGATAHVAGKRDAWEGWEDAAVPPERLGDYLRDFRALLNKFEYGCSLYGHFGQGCVHTRIDFDLKSAEGIKQFRRFVEEAADLVVSYGGSLSGEHGDGQSRAELLNRMFGDELIEAFREFKSIWDPRWKMNPGKVVNPYRLDENLRLGADYKEPKLETHFKYPQDKGSFGYAMERCVGVGKCRKTDSGTMCPSYMVTKEEKHSTRGRARLLFEMINGGVIGKNGWRDESVKEALDLCLACKGCKTECPVSVDMATYKAEFRAHYYKGRLRPRAAYAMGLIYWWARVASKAPGVVNFFTSNPPFSTIAKWFGGLAREREMPQFAPETFTAWFKRRATRNASGDRVILWPDTFTNYFDPKIAKAAVESLEAAGFHVDIPRRSLCCGRPLYDFGMLNTAKALLRQIIHTLRDDIESDTPIVGLEPSCVAVFRDELVNLYPESDLARRLSKNVLTFAEFFDKHAKTFPMPALDRKAKAHGHCHQKAIMGFTPDQQLMKRLGLDFSVLDSGCCGMAGSFGFEKENYEVSVQCGEQRLLPSVRNSDHNTVLIADGFSCREQIAQMSTRRARHIAEVVQMAIRGDDTPSTEDVVTDRHRRPKKVNGWIATGLAVAGVAVAASILGRKRR